MRLNLLLCRKFPKSSFRRPMEGRGVGKAKGLFLWPTSFGELDEERNVHSRMIPTRDKIPEIMVPDLKDFTLKAYVTYRAKNAYEPPSEAKYFFDTFYAPEVEADMQNIPLENLPENSSDRRTGGNLFSSLKKSAK